MQVSGQTATGAPKETFGTGAAAQSEAGHKGADISGELLARSLFFQYCNCQRVPLIADSPVGTALQSALDAHMVS